ncbi:MAG: alpha/beta hydrolase [Sphingobium sp.]
MKPAILLSGTLCDGRAFGTLPEYLAAPLVLDHSSFSDARTAAAVLLPSVPPGSLGIAFSLGGWILLEMLRLAPSHFGGILLISGNAHPDMPENAEARRERINLAREAGFDALFAMEWPLMLGQDRQDDPSIRSIILAMAEDAGHAVHARQAEMNISRPDHRALATNPPLPIHVVAGAEDRLCPRERYEVAASGPSSSLTIAEGVGHYLPLEAPDVLPPLLKSRFPEYCA